MAENDLAKDGHEPEYSVLLGGLTGSFNYGTVKGMYLGLRSKVVEYMYMYSACMDQGGWISSKFGLLAFPPSHPWRLKVKTPPSPLANPATLMRFLGQ